MKRTCPLVLLSLFCFCQYSFSQTQVKGQILDNQKQAFPKATVLLVQASDSSLVKGAIADLEGRFSFDAIAPGAYRIQCQMYGYAPLNSAVFRLEAGTALKELGAFTLEQGSIQLKEGVIVAKRPPFEVKIDRNTVNVANSINDAGGTALDILQRSPGVQVNRLSKTISLVGKEGVVVMINGKISRLPTDAVVQMLQGLNANNIDHIDLIHTPPANFEAEGNAGIINIVLKTTGDEGFNGGYSANIGYGFAEKYGAGTYFNYRKKKINLFGNYDYNYNINPQRFTNFRGVQLGNDFLETATNSRRPFTPTGMHNASLGLDYQISKKTIIGVLGTFFDSHWYMRASNDIVYKKNGLEQAHLLMPNTETNHNRSFTGNVNFTHHFTERASLNVDVDLISYKINNPSQYFVHKIDTAGYAVPQYQLRIGKQTPIRVAVAKADYTYRFNEKLNVEAGAKLTVLHFENDVKVDSLPAGGEWVLMPEYTSLFVLNENVSGAYTSFTAKLSSKTDLKGGLRYEYTNTNLGSKEMPNVVDRHYGSWFPSLFIGHKLSEIQNLHFSYSRRITRPQIRWLAPWLIFSDPTTLQGGNPAVQPSFTNTIAFDYGYKSIHFSVDYSLQDAPVAFVPVVDAKTNRQISRPQNLRNTKVWSANFSFPAHPGKWWDLQCNLYLNHTESNLTIDGRNIQLANVNYGYNVVNTIKLPHHFTLEISGNYNSPGYWGVAKWRATGAANIGIQKDFGEKWGKLRLNASDLFLSTNWFGTTNQPEINLRVNQSFQFAERVVMLSWTNSFGNRKLKSSRERQTGATEEAQRIKG